MKMYVHYQLLVSVWIVFILIAVHVVDWYMNWLSCSDDGLSWVYNKPIVGMLFCLLQMMCIQMQSLMMAKLFFKVPDSLGYFGLE